MPLLNCFGAVSKCSVAVSKCYREVTKVLRSSYGSVPEQLRKCSGTICKSSGAVISLVDTYKYSRTLISLPKQFVSATEQLVSATE